MDRLEWCARHPKGHYSAHFGPREVMRCPRQKKRASGRLVTCGGALGNAPSRVDYAIVYTCEAPASQPFPEGTEVTTRTCLSCKQTALVYLVARQDLRAAG